VIQAQGYPDVCAVEGHAGGTGVGSKAGEDCPIAGAQLYDTGSCVTQILAPSKATPYGEPGTLNVPRVLPSAARSLLIVPS